MLRAKEIRLTHQNSNKVFIGNIKVSFWMFTRNITASSVIAKLQKSIKKSSNVTDSISNGGKVQTRFKNRERHLRSLNQKSIGEKES